MKSLRKKNVTLCAILGMKLLNTDIIDIVADDKKLDWCLIQGWCFKKSLSTVPKRKNYVFQRCKYTLRVHDVTLNLVKFVYSLMSEMCGGSQKYSLQPLKSLQITDSADRFPNLQIFSF